MPTNSNPCSCGSCPGPKCNCGCQAKKTDSPATCRCGDGCACGQACGCKRS